MKSSDKNHIRDIMKPLKKPNSCIQQGARVYCRIAASKSTQSSGTQAQASDLLESMGHCWDSGGATQIFLDFQNAQDAGPMSQNRQYTKCKVHELMAHIPKWRNQQYRVHYLGHLGGPGGCTPLKTHKVTALS